MKKKYEAPAYDVITYSLHDAIAGGCANQVTITIVVEIVN